MVVLLDAVPTDFFTFPAWYIKTSSRHIFYFPLVLVMTSTSGTVGLMMEHLITPSFIDLGKEVTLSYDEAIQ